MFEPPIGTTYSKTIAIDFTKKNLFIFPQFFFAKYLKKLKTHKSPTKMFDYSLKTKFVFHDIVKKKRQSEQCNLFFLSW